MNLSQDLLAASLKMILSLGLVLALLFAMVVLLKRFLKRDSAFQRDKLIRVVSNQFVGVKKSVSLVEIPGAILVLGITNDRITLLSEINEKERIEEIHSRRKKKPASFKNALGAYIPSTIQKMKNTKIINVDTL